MSTQPNWNELLKQEENYFISLGAELIRESQKYRFSCAPNPCVGSALLKRENFEESSNFVVLSKGFHQVWGGPHAEVNVFQSIKKEKLKEVEGIIVTLEPCSRKSPEKKTPACIELILSHKQYIRFVVICSLDPDHKHAGRAIEILTASNISVLSLSHLSLSLSLTAPHFLHWLSTTRIARPWTIAKWAQTISCQLSPSSGRIISGGKCMGEVQKIRGSVDCILTSIQTVTIDNPKLTVRPPGELVRGAPPIRVILDSHLKISETSEIFSTISVDFCSPSNAEHGGPIHIVCISIEEESKKNEKERKSDRIKVLSKIPNVFIHQIPSDSTKKHVSLVYLQQVLYNQIGVRRVLLEAGPTLIESYCKDNLVDQVRIVTNVCPSLCPGNGLSLDRVIPQTLSEKLQSLPSGSLFPSTSPSLSSLIVYDQRCDSEPNDENDLVFEGFVRSQI